MLRRKSGRMSKQPLPQGGSLQVWDVFTALHNLDDPQQVGPARPQ